MTARRAVRELGLAFITAGVVILAFVAYQLWGTGLAEAHNQSVLRKAFDAALAHHGPSGSPASPASGPAPHDPVVGATTGASGAAPAGASAALPAKAVDHLVIPAIGVDKYVVEGVAEADLREGPGHYPGTPMPGQPGNAAIAGHRTTYGAPFFRLNDLHIGDPIYLTDTAGQRFVYRVSRLPVAVAPTDVAVLDPTPDAQLTLTTCNPRYSATSRLVVVATLDGTADPAPATSSSSATQHPTTSTAPTASAASSGGHPTLAAGTPTLSLGAGDPGAWPAVIGYGLLALAGWVAVRLVAHRSRRWRKAGIVVAGIALCAVPLWFCFENVVLLLPQSI